MKASLNPTRLRSTPGRDADVVARAAMSLDIELLGNETRAGNSGAYLSLRATSGEPESFEAS